MQRHLRALRHLSSRTSNAGRRPVTAGRIATAAGAMLIMVGGLMFGPAGIAHAEGSASNVNVTGTLDKNGTFRVDQQITFSGSAPGNVSQTFETSETLVGNRSREFELSKISVTADGKQLSPQIKTDGDLETVSFDPAGAKSATLSYTVTGAVVNESGTPALQWRVLQGLSMPVDKFDAKINIPGAFSYVRCTSGPPNATTPCTSASAGVSNTPTFTDGPRGPGEVVAIDIGFPAGVVAINEKIDEHWTVARAFSAKPLPLGIALGLLVLGGIGLLVAHRRIGRDSQPTNEIHKPAEFVPVAEGQAEFRIVGDIRPGHVGTVVDERVDPIDITASLLDLAVRGHVLITELPRQSTYARADWRLTRAAEGEAPDDLRPFERELLEAVAPQGESVLVSELGTRVHQDAVAGVQSALYDEMVANGWFQRRPDATRNTWTRAALAGLVVAVVITALLAIFTEFGLVGITLILLALGLMFIGQEMPARTAQGSALLAGLGALRSDLLTTPTDRMPAGRELSELSEVLPYAVVLGGADRWLDGIVAADDDDDPDPEDLSWYHGPSDWQLSDLPHSLQNFVTTVNGTLFSR
ncbi:DUF2207 domain-containing protein [Microlunatus elymi]|uniref:DUF2207 domain-containing protein n=1 Tax=Microlunatus elymi TaxID=2596828 RepID=A0A516Q479_9ACTN|nr:DUF2207 domain-containing protein [Microlunatus elymi]QDP98185.1 DUF2207 domain-containing protein [Microlunatus elymi]